MLRTASVVCKISQCKNWHLNHVFSQRCLSKKALERAASSDKKPFGTCRPLSSGNSQCCKRTIVVEVTEDDRPHRITMEKGLHQGFFAFDVVEVISRRALVESKLRCRLECGNLSEASSSTSVHKAGFGSNLVPSEADRSGAVALDERFIAKCDDTPHRMQFPMACSRTTLSGIFTVSKSVLLRTRKCLKCVSPELNFHYHTILATVLWLSSSSLNFHTCFIKKHDFWGLLHTSQYCSKGGTTEHCNSNLL